MVVLKLVTGVIVSMPNRFHIHFFFVKCGHVKSGKMQIYLDYRVPVISGFRRNRINTKKNTGYLIFKKEK